MDRAACEDAPTLDGATAPRTRQTAAAPGRFHAVAQQLQLGGPRAARLVRKGGLMGSPWDAFPADVNEREGHRANENRSAALFLRLKVYFLASVWLSWRSSTSCGSYHFFLHLIPDGPAAKSLHPLRQTVQPACWRCPSRGAGFGSGAAPELRRVPDVVRPCSWNHGSRVVGSLAY